MATCSWVAGSCTHDGETSGPCPGLSVVAASIALFSNCCLVLQPVSSGRGTRCELLCACVMKLE